MLNGLVWFSQFPIALVWVVVSAVVFPILKLVRVWTPRTIDYRRDMRSKVVIVTGSNTGIGKRTASNILKMGAEVVMACRSATRAEAARAEIEAEVQAIDPEDPRFPHAKHGKLSVMILDLSCLKSVRAFADTFRQRYKRLDVLICNAGLAPTPGLTKQGFDLVWGTNYLGHFALITHLLPVIKSTKDARVVNLSSLAHQFGSLDYEASAWRRYRSLNDRVFGSTYADSKFAMVLLTIELRRRGIEAIAVNPGAVASDIWRAFSPLYRAMVLDPASLVLFMDNEQGSTTTVAAATQALGSPTPLYLMPYWAPEGLIMPFDAIGPYTGWQANAPRLPRNAEKAALDLWQYSEQLLESARNKS